MPKMKIVLVDVMCPRVNVNKLKLSESYCRNLLRFLGCRGTTSDAITNNKNKKIHYFLWLHRQCGQMLRRKKKPLDIGFIVIFIWTGYSWTTIVSMFVGVAIVVGGSGRGSGSSGVTRWDTWCFSHACTFTVHTYTHIPPNIFYKTFTRKQSQNLFSDRFHMNKRFSEW